MSSLLIRNLQVSRISIVRLHLVKHALQPYQQVLVQSGNGALNNMKRFRYREFYDMFKSQHIDSNETMRISYFLASYCAADKHDWLDTCR